MPTKIKDVQPPRGMARRLYRLPIWLFRLHLGWLLISHFLLLTHTGRKSGLPRQTVLEVLWHEKAGDVYYVLAAWGEQSDWVKNIEQTPQVTIADGRRRFRAQAARLVRYLPRLLGYRTDGSEADLRALTRLGIVVGFTPASPRSSGNR
jgi:deazaflavin-dependent oxidoreductase (nitroreductase family)